MKTLFMFALLLVIIPFSHAHAQDVYVEDLDIVCTDENDITRLDLMKSVLKLGNDTFTVTHRSQSRNTRMLYNGDFFKTKWPVTDLVLKNAHQELKLAYFAEEGSKNVNYGRVEITMNGEKTTFSNCNSMARIY